jgi:hypothetical protein
MGFEKDGGCCDSVGLKMCVTKCAMNCPCHFDSASTCVTSHLASPNSGANTVARRCVIFTPIAHRCSHERTQPTHLRSPHCQRPTPNAVSPIPPCTTENPAPNARLPLFPHRQRIQHHLLLMAKSHGMHPLHTSTAVGVHQVYIATLLIYDIYLRLLTQVRPLLDHRKCTVRCQI